MACFRHSFALVSMLFATITVADDRIRMIAHRGGVVSDAVIENNVTAIEEAVRRGYWMVEVDVRQSLDNVPIVHHDADFKRYYGDARKVAKLTWSQISKLRATPGNERPLTFDEYLSAVDGRMRIMLDFTPVSDTRCPQFDLAGSALHCPLLAASVAHHERMTSRITCLLVALDVLIHFSL